MIEIIEIYGKYSCDRAKKYEGMDYYECIYEVEYHKHSDEIVNIDCQIRFTDEDHENLEIYDYKPPKAEMDMILDHIDTYHK